IGARIACRGIAAIIGLHNPGTHDVTPTASGGVHDFDLRSLAGVSGEVPRIPMQRSRVLARRAKYHLVADDEPDGVVGQVTPTAGEQLDVMLCDGEGWRGQGARRSIAAAIRELGRA